MRRLPVVVPMTIVRDDHLDEIVRGLRSQGVDVRHCALIASARTLRRAAEKPRLTSWRYQLRRLSVSVRHIR